MLDMHAGGPPMTDLSAPDLHQRRRHRRAHGRRRWFGQDRSRGRPRPSEAQSSEQAKMKRRGGRSSGSHQRSFTRANVHRREHASEAEDGLTERRGTCWALAGTSVAETSSLSPIEFIRPIGGRRQHHRRRERVMLDRKDDRRAANKSKKGMNG